jgi:hypothetical protein
MTFELRALDPAQDEEMFKASYDWILKSPAWFQYLEGIVATVNNCYSFDDYLKSAMRPNEVNIGLFNSSLQAVYTIQDQGDGSFQVHVGAAPNVDRLALIAGASQLREWLLTRGARDVYGWIASINRPMKKFAEQAGFTYCGVSVFKGSLNDKPIRWLRMQAVS